MLYQVRTARSPQHFITTVCTRQQILNHPELRMVSTGLLRSGTLQKEYNLI